jgi:hypothetical protein
MYISTFLSRKHNKNEAFRRDILRERHVNA